MYVHMDAHIYLHTYTQYIQYIDMKCSAAGGAPCMTPQLGADTVPERRRGIDAWRNACYVTVSSKDPSRRRVFRLFCILF